MFLTFNFFVFCITFELFNVFIRFLNFLVFLYNFSVYDTSFYNCVVWGMELFEDPTPREVLGGFMIVMVIMLSVPTSLEVVNGVSFVEGTSASSMSETVSLV